MSKHGPKPSNADQSPEALATFAATARNEGERPKDHPDRATNETAPIPAEPKAKDDAARAVLRKGVGLDHEPIKEAVSKVPDRTKK